MSLILAAVVTVSLGAVTTAMGCDSCGCSTGAKAEGAAEAEKPELKPQTTCPVMGGKINRDAFVDVKGQRVYVCCSGCIAPIKADPDKYLAKIAANGERAEAVPAAKSGKCGDAKGRVKSCQPAAE
jgi:hypothetical protein